MSPPPTAFTRRVLEVVAGTRPGDLLTYGEVAREAGRPGAARAVGHALARHGHTVAWWRVVSASGRLVPGRETDHRAHLQAEGVACDEGRVAARSGPSSGPRSGPTAQVRAERTVHLGMDGSSR